MSECRPYGRQRRPYGRQRRPYSPSVPPLVASYLPSENRLKYALGVFYCRAGCVLGQPIAGRVVMSRCLSHLNFSILFCLFIGG